MVLFIAMRLTHTYFATPPVQSEWFQAQLPMGTYTKGLRDNQYTHTHSSAAAAKCPATFLRLINAFASPAVELLLGAWIL
jgi:hypothetical protein